MDPGIAAITGAAITGTASIFAAFLARNEIHLRLRKASVRIDGVWLGKSAYVAGNVKTPVSEMLYNVEMEIKQSGRRVRIKETITDFFDADGNKIESASRTVTGAGKIIGDRDVVVTFSESESLTCGTMYLTVDAYGKEIEGMIAVRNPDLGTPVAVKLLLRRRDLQGVEFDELDVARIHNTLLGRKRNRKT